MVSYRWFIDVQFFTKYVTTEDADKVQFPLTLGKPNRARILPKMSGLIL